MNLLVRSLICMLMLIPARQQSAEWVSKVTATFLFGSTLEISAAVQPELDQKIFLVLQPQGQTSRQIEINPSPEGLIEITYDLKKDPLRPFARVYYWFEMENPDGDRQQSASFWFDYLDNRYTWKTSTTELFEIAWVEGGADFGQRLQEVAQAGLKKATQILPIAPELPVRIFIYPDSAALNGALELTQQDWAAGSTLPEIGVILVSNGSPTSDLVEMERQIPHELMHLLIYQATNGSPGNAPAWLIEGLATYAELYPDPDLRRALTEKQSQGELLPMESLCPGFAPEADQAQLGYAQSAAFTEYLLSRFGADRINALLQASTNGQSCANLVESVLGVSLSQLENEWLQTSFENNASPRTVSPFLVAGLAGGGFVLIGLVFVLRKRHNQTKP